MIKAITFDLFGTLTNGVANPEKKIIQTFNLKSDYPYIERFVCGTYFRNWDQYLGTIIKAFDIPDTKKSREILIDIFSKDISKERLNQKVIDQIKKLKTRNYKLGVLSNIPNPLYDILRKDNLRTIFDTILYSYECGLFKPDPEFFKLMLSSIRVNACEMLMIGDSLVRDIKPARNLGINTIHYKNPSQLKKELASLSINLE